MHVVCGFFFLFTKCSTRLSSQKKDSFCKKKILIDKRERKKPFPLSILIQHVSSKNVQNAFPIFRVNRVKNRNIFFLLSKAGISISFFPFESQFRWMFGQSTCKFLINLFRKIQTFTFIRNQEKNSCGGSIYGHIMEQFSLFTSTTLRHLR